MHKHVLGKSEEVAEDTKSMVSTTSRYHTMLVKIPNASDASARKRLIKNPNENIKARHCKIPDKVMARIAAAAAKSK